MANPSLRRQFEYAMESHVPAFADADDIAMVERLIAAHGGRGALLPVLHAVQDAFGYIDEAVIPLIASGLNLTRAEVHGVVSFYHDFRSAPAGRHVVKLCRAESCQARGAAALEVAAVERLGVKMGSTRADGQVTLEPVYCLGLCATGPNALVDGAPVARLDAAGLDAIAARVAA